MKYTYEELETIADKSGHDCHLCHQPIKFEAYGDQTHPNGWEVDHVRPRSKKGHSGFTNLRAAHAHCNRKKGNRSNRSVRSHFGVKGTPPSTTKRILKGVGYTALGIGAIWVLGQIFKPKPTSLVNMNKS
jgi:5-methylcytosine-specific restriction endonuclease McrA